MELTFKNLSKRYGGRPAVNDISFSMRNGVYGLLGVNGAGKTTLMRMLCTLTRPSGGSILWDGRDIFQMGGEYRRLLGYLPQEFGYYPEFTVRDYLMYISSIKGIRPAAAKQRTNTLLKQVGLSDAGHQKMKTLSGGMKRRAGIAQAMLNDPRILILDEPTAGLDPRERVRFRNLISELSGDRIVLLSTHIVSDVAYIAKDILLMDAGRLLLSGSADQLAASMEEQVWLVNVTRETAEQMLHACKVSNIKTSEMGAELRIISGHAPAEGAVPVQPTLEDVFLYYFGTKAGDDYGTI